MRICILGRANYQLLHERIRQLALLNQDVHLITVQPGQPVGCTVHTIKGLERLGPLRYLVALPLIRRRLRALQPDIIDVHGLSSYGVYGLAPLAGIPYIATMYGPDVNVHGRQRKFLAWIAKRALTAANRVYSSTAMAKEDIQQVLGLDVTAKFWSRSWGIATDAIMAQSKERRQQIRQEFGLSEETRVILHNRQFTDFWHVQNIVESMPQVLAAYPGSEYWFVYPPLNQEGEETLQRERQRVAALGLAAKVRFLGPQPYERMIAIMHAADIYLCVGKSDLLASSLLEALCVGLVPVLNSLPAYREVVEQRVNGLLLAGTDRQTITEGLLEVLQVYPTLRQQYAAHNEHLIREQYDTQQTTAWLIRQFATVAAIPASELNLPLKTYPEV